MLLAVGLGVPLGILSAVYRDTWVDQLTRVVSVSGIAIPAFWLGLMLQLLVALQLGILPLGGRLGLMAAPPAPVTHLLYVDALLAGQWGVLGDALAHAVLPTVTLCFPALASIVRVNRAEMLETLKQDYIVNARAQGVSELRIVGLYALKNAMIPTLAMIGLRYGWMLGGTVLVETVFDWPGIGLYAVASAVSSDFQPIMGVSLRIGLIITLLAAVIGVPLGIVAGYIGGPLGETIMRVTDVFLSVPALVLALAIVGALGPGITNAIVALGLVWWPGYVRLVQSKTLALKGQTFVEAARAVGTGRLRIVFVHILPNCVSPITVKASMDMGSAILAAAGLGFVGLGAQPPYPEWGAMISHGRNYLPTWWWYSAFPGLAIYLTVLGFNLLGDGLRDLLDPKSRVAA